MEAGFQVRFMETQETKGYLRDGAQTTDLAQPSTTQYVTEQVLRTGESIGGRSLSIIGRTLANASGSARSYSPMSLMGQPATTSQAAAKFGHGIEIQNGDHMRLDDPRLRITGDVSVLIIAQVPDTVGLHHLFSFGGGDFGQERQEFNGLYGLRFENGALAYGHEYGVGENQGLTSTKRGEGGLYRITLQREAGSRSIVARVNGEDWIRGTYVRAPEGGGSGILMLGAETGGPNEDLHFLEGAILEFRIWNRVVPQATLDDLASATQPWRVEGSELGLWTFEPDRNDRPVKRWSLDHRSQARELMALDPATLAMGKLTGEWQYMCDEEDCDASLTSLIATAPKQWLQFPLTDKTRLRWQSKEAPFETEFLLPGHEWITTMRPVAVETTRLGTQEVSVVRLRVTSALADPEAAAQEVKDSFEARVKRFDRFAYNVGAATTLDYSPDHGIIVRAETERTEALIVEGRDSSGKSVAISHDWRQEETRQAVSPPDRRGAEKTMDEIAAWLVT